MLGVRICGLRTLGAKCNRWWKVKSQLVLKPRASGLLCEGSITTALIIIMVLQLICWLNVTQLLTRWHRVRLNLFQLSYLVLLIFWDWCLSCKIEPRASLLPFGYSWLSFDTFTSVKEIFQKGFMRELGNAWKQP